MNASLPTDRCSLVVCRCLQVSEDQVLEALATRDIRTVKDIRRHTGAGDGCTACHQRLAEYLRSAGYSASAPICSAR